MPTCRRRIPIEIVSPLGAELIYSSPSRSPDDGGLSQSHTINDADVIGIKFKGWTITTKNSSIGEETRMERLTSLLEDAANSTECTCLDPFTTSSDDLGTNSTSISNTNLFRQEAKFRRRLCLPEITFLDALVSLKYYPNHDSNLSVENKSKNLITEIRFTAEDALIEWAEAHKYIEQSPYHTPKHHGTQNGNKSCSQKNYRGVSILQTVHAEKWSEKQRNFYTCNDAKVEFYYDWTFASPYASTILHYLPPTSDNLEMSTTATVYHGINNRSAWENLSCSQIPFDLLQDTSQPILLYDDVSFYEDDLHDNGDVSLNVKIRVMPKCWYILQRLFIRVDYICVKCREVRIFCLLDDENISRASAESYNRVNTIYRDISWKEASWDDLAKLNLPLDPGLWRAQGKNAEDNVLFESQLRKLPITELPIDLPTYSSFKIHE